jgi:hypothetical protein
MKIEISNSAIGKAAAGILVAVALVAAGIWVGPRLAAPRPAPKPAPAPAPTPKPDWFGGLNYPAGARALIASMPRLSQAAPALMTSRDAADKRPILLYKAWKDLFNDYPSYVAQSIGDCTSFGHAHALDLMQTIDFALANPGKTPTPDAVQEVSTEALYGMAREVAGLLGQRTDGCYGFATVKALTEGGAVSRRMLGDQGPYSGRRAKLWGTSGTPAGVKALAARYKLGSAARVGSWDELVAALSQAHPVTICSQMGFTLVRDADGFVQRKGSWGHCMFISGIRFDREGACIVQSWGPDTPTGPRALDQPSFSFWVTRADIEAILSEGDSWALSRAPRFGQSAAHRRRLPRSWRDGTPAPAVRRAA